jgi:hypothetical protein
MLLKLRMRINCFTYDFKSQFSTQTRISPNYFPLLFWRTKPFFMQPIALADFLAKDGSAQMIIGKPHSILFGNP